MHCQGTNRQAAYRYCKIYFDLISYGKIKLWPNITLQVKPTLQNITLLCQTLHCISKYHTAFPNITLVSQIYILPDQTDELHLGSCPENLLPTPHYSSKRLFNRSFRREPQKYDFLSIPRILPLSYRYVK